MDHRHDQGRFSERRFPDPEMAESSETGRDPERPVVKNVEFQPLPETAPAPVSRGVAPQFFGVTLQLSTELGKITLPVRELINLQTGSTLKLQRVADERVLILVNEAPFAHGEVVVINERFGVRVTALLDGESTATEQNR